jgi:NADPH-dependent 2,4-dienoyl-CoA reductase/sulfur reductase-like enzyme
VSEPSVVIVGAGPAGLSAAVTAAEAGLRVTVVDERPAPGGRLRYDLPGRNSLEWYLDECARLGVVLRSSTVAWGMFPGWTLALETPNGPDVIESDNVILATGSTDRALAFAGNALPGVLSGIGLRRLIGEFGVLPGKRALVLGYGPDAAATAHAVRTAGGQVLMLISEDEARSIVVSGSPGVEQVTIGGKSYEIDIVAVAVGRQPDVLLATMAELEMVWVPGLGGWVPLHHLNGDGGLPGLYLAGDAAGIDNVEICEFEGAMVATILAGRLGVLDPALGVEMRAELAIMRPARMAAYDADPTYEQPWRVPLEVNR